MGSSYSWPVRLSRTVSVWPAVLRGGVVSVGHVCSLLLSGPGSSGLNAPARVSIDSDVASGQLDSVVRSSPLTYASAVPCGNPVCICPNL